jgi:hypothetical protein
MKLRTVMIDRGGQPVRINESDFNPERDKQWSGSIPDPTSSDPEAEPAAAPEAEEESETNEVEIISHPGGWFTVEVNGESVTENKVRRPVAESIAEEYRE